MKENLTLDEAIKAVDAAAAETGVRRISAISTGEVCQQGDLYLSRVQDDWPRGKAIGKDSVQVALGTGNGARHMAEGKVQVFEGKQLPGVKVPEGVDPGQMLGPVIVAGERWALAHPEHAHFSIPAGTYQVSHQYDPRTMRRTVD